MEKINKYIWYKLYNDSLPIIDLHEDFYFEIVNDWRETRINIKKKNSNMVMHSSALYKFSFLLIQTSLNFNPIIGDSYTKSEARGLNLYVFALKRLVEIHFEKSSRPINALVVPNNVVPNLKLPKIGFRQIRTIKFLRILNLPIYFRLFN